MVQTGKAKFLTTLFEFTRGYLTGDFAVLTIGGTVAEDCRQVMEDTWYGMSEVALSIDKWALTEYMFVDSGKQRWH